jgi:hypothetical protein
LKFSTDKYFSVAYDDTISVWEDESFAFDVLSNDYMAGGKADIVESSIVSISSSTANKVNS